MLGFGVIRRRMHPLATGATVYKSGIASLGRDDSASYLSNSITTNENQEYRDFDRHIEKSSDYILDTAHYLSAKSSISQNGGIVAKSQQTRARNAMHHANHQ